MAHPFPAQHRTEHPQYHTGVDLFQLLGLDYRHSPCCWWRSPSSWPRCKHATPEVMSE
jgi:hypothetical protein